MYLIATATLHSPGVGDSKDAIVNLFGKVVTWISFEGHEAALGLAAAT